MTLHVKDTKFPVSVIVPMRNSATTIITMLDSVRKQDYPIKEIIIVDNVSKDNSIELVEQYRKKHKDIPVQLIKNKVNIGVGASYNKGVNVSESDYVVFMHSDSMLPTNKELTKLTQPFRKDNRVIASYSIILHPEKVWQTYNFWMKCLMARVVGKESPGLNDKFDCLKKNVFLSIGGFNDRDYGHHQMVGSEDAALHLELRKKGKVIASDARVVHLHYLNNDYSFQDYLTNHKLLARSYGRIIRLRWKELEKGAFAFGIKPALAFIGVIPQLFPYNIVMLFVFSLWYMQKMYTTKSTLTDYRIFLLPFITIFFIYYETFWMIESFLYLNKKK